MFGEPYVPVTPFDGGAFVASACSGENGDDREVCIDCLNSGIEWAHRVRVLHCFAGVIILCVGQESNLHLAPCVGS